MEIRGLVVVVFRSTGWLLCFDTSFVRAFLALEPVSFNTRGRGLTFTAARVPVQAHVDGPGSQHTGAEDHTSCVSRALVPTFAVLPPHVCRRQKIRAVSVGSHMQQDMGQAPPHLGASFPLFDTAHVKKPRAKKMAITSGETCMSIVSVATRVFRPAGRHLHRRVIAVS